MIDAQAAFIIENSGLVIFKRVIGVQYNRNWPNTRYDVSKKLLKLKNPRNFEFPSLHPCFVSSRRKIVNRVELNNAFGLARRIFTIFLSGNVRISFLVSDSVFLDVLQRLLRPTTNATGVDGVAINQLLRRRQCLSLLIFHSQQRINDAISRESPA